MASELFPAYSFPTSITQSNDLIIRPLFCDDPVINSDASLKSLCYSPGNLVPVYTKDESLRVTALRNLDIQNIMFDGSEDILKYQPTTSLANV